MAALCADPPHILHNWRFGINSFVLHYIFKGMQMDKVGNADLAEENEM